MDRSGAGWSIAGDHPMHPSILQERFLLHLPRIQAHARFTFRHIRCQDTKADLMAELIALAWSSFLRLTRRGKRPEEFISTLAVRCGQAVRSGRRLARQDSARDVLSPVACRQHAFSVTTFGTVSALSAWLRTDPRACISDQAAFRIDFLEWRSALAHRKRLILDALASGSGTGEVAEQFGLCPARISQLRRSFRDSWEALHRGSSPLQ
jgi:hypothetical protein